MQEQPASKKFDTDPHLPANSSCSSGACVFLWGLLVVFGLIAGGNGMCSIYSFIVVIGTIVSNFHLQTI
jgi:hypothetical protein